MNKLLFYFISLSLLNVSNLEEVAFSQPICQKNVNEVLNQIRDLGVRQVFFKVHQEIANQSYRGNPTSRSDSLDISLSQYPANSAKVDKQSESVINNILSSPELMKTWADKIVANCGNTATVNFSFHNSDYGYSYAIQADGKTKRRECVSRDFWRDHSTQLTWNQEFCP